VFEVLATDVTIFLVAFWLANLQKMSAQVLKNRAARRRDSVRMVHRPLINHFLKVVQVSFLVGQKGDNDLGGPGDCLKYRIPELA
jgi:hypothetical protein